MLAIIKDSDNKKLFQVKSALDKRIETTQGYWQKITVVKHPSIEGRRKETKETTLNAVHGRKTSMAKTREQELKTVKIHYDSLGNTLNVWFGDPKKEFISEETGDEVILNKDKKGKVIGFEKLNFLKQGNAFVKSLPVEVFVQ